MKEKITTIINNNLVDENEKASLITQATNSSTTYNQQQQLTFASISRPIYNERKFQNDFSSTIDTEHSHDNNDERKENSRYAQTCHKLISCIHPRNLLEIFTIINFVVEYDFKKNFFADLFSGLTGKYDIDIETLKI